MVTSNAMLFLFKPVTPNGIYGSVVKSALIGGENSEKINHEPNEQNELVVCSPLFSS
jgi:hypothetical protein